MFCRQVEKELISYIKKLLSPNIETRMKTHLDKCPKCSRKTAELRKALEFYQKGEEIELSADFDSVLAQKIESQKIGLEKFPKRKQLIVDYFWPGWVWGAMAVAAVIITVFFLPQLMKKPSPDIQIAKTDIKPTSVQYVSVKAKSSDNRDIESLRAQEPFLPASNIELNVLPKRENVQLTIYNSADLTLVREQRNLTLKKGWNWLQFMWSNTLIDPTSLHLEPLEYKNKVEVQALVFPPRIRELGRWLIFSEVSGEVPVEITYLTSGLSWRAFYTGTLDPAEKNMRLKGYVRAVNNSGEDYENAQTRLIVGKVHMLDKIAGLAKRRYAYGRPGTLVEGDITEPSPTSVRLGYILNERLDAKLKQIKKEGLSEYFLYTIEGTETIPTGWSKRLPSFNTSEIPVLNLYKYEEERYGNQVVRFLNFKNDEAHKLGDTPIPGGMLKVYRTVDKAGHFSYAGQSSFKYIPIDEDVELNLGPVGNIVVEPEVMDYKTDHYLFDRDGNVSGWDEIRQIKFEVKNTRQVPVKVEIQRNFNTKHWKIVNKGGYGKYDKVDMDTVKYTLELEPGSKQEFTQVLTTKHGRRAE